MSQSSTGAQDSTTNYQQSKQQLQGTGYNQSVLISSSNSGRIGEMKAQRNLQEYNTTTSTINTGSVQSNLQENVKTIGNADTTQPSDASLYASRLYNIRKLQNNKQNSPFPEETEAQCDEILTTATMTNNEKLLKQQPDLLARNTSNTEDSSLITGQKMSDTLFEEQGMSSSITKKSNFSVVCMLPSKQPRGQATTSQAQKDRNHQIIEKQTLQRILQLQQQYRESRVSGGSYFNSSSANQQNVTSSLSSQNQQFATSANNSTYSNQGAFQSHSSPSKYMTQSAHLKPHSLILDKIGLCGIPSLWVQKEDLIKDKHLHNEVLHERERVDKILRILQIHKKYENEKYFGGQGIYKRGSTNQTNAYVNGAQAGSSFINQDYVQFSTEILISKQKGQNRDEKINSIVKDEGQCSTQQYCDISNEKNQQFNSQQQTQVFPHIRNFDNPEQLLFKILQAEAKLIRMILESHGFQHTESNDWNILWTCTSTQQKPYMYENLNENQKINHFMNTSELTRKDRLCFNVGKMQIKYGKNSFDFLPETYILPDEFSEFYKSFNQNLTNSDQDKLNNLWIIKPTASSQGKGIFMINEISEVPLNEPLVISKYIGNPLLINGLKFDLRLYVLITSFDPLKIYIYNEGLVRFASEPYDISNSKQNVYAHLTNYSINKKSEHFIQNKNISQRDFGNKWSLSALQIHLQNLGIDMKIVWERIYDAIIKSILSIEPHVFNALKKIQNVNNTQNKSNSFDLLGFDIILDSELKPWILEVNLSPSLAFDSPLDFHIKSNLLVDTFNIVGVKKFTRRRDFLGKQLKVKTSNNQQTNSSTNQVISNDQKKRYQSALNMSQQNAQNGGQQLNKTETQGIVQNIAKQSIANVDSAVQKNQFEGIDISHVEKLSKISAKHRELLREHLEEFARNRKQNFTRVYPSPGCSSYDIYFEQPRPLNKLLYKYLYQQNELQDIINLINKSQNKHHQNHHHNHIHQEPYSDILAFNQQNSSTHSILKQEKINAQAYSTNQYDASQKPPLISNQQNEIELQLHQNRSSSMSSIKNQLQSPKTDAKVSIKQQDGKQDDKLSDFEPSMSPLQRKRLEEKRSVTSNKKKEQDANNILKLPLNPMLTTSVKSSTANPLINSTVARNPTIPGSGTQTSLTQNDQDKQSIQDKDQEEKVIITGDDILIEYVRRVMQTVKMYQNEISQPSVKKLEQFLTHKVWYSKNSQNRQAESQLLWQRIESKHIEMQERKRRLFIKKLQQDGSNTGESDKLFIQNEKQKEDIIKDFTSNELEQMLIQSNKNNQIEVVSILLCGQNSIMNGMYYNSGILTKIEKESQRLSKNSSQMLKLTKISVDQTNSQSDNNQLAQNTSEIENYYSSPKDSSQVDKSQILTRMRTSDDKFNQSQQNSQQQQQQQYYPFNYKTQQVNYEQLHSSYSHQKSSTYGQSSVLYQSNQASSKQNLLHSKSGKKTTHAVDRDFTMKDSEKKITLPQINNNHLSQDYSRVSVQLNNGLCQNNNNGQQAPLNQEEQMSKYRTRISNEKYFVKQVRQQSLQSEKSNKQSSLKIARNQTNTKFERLDI